VLQRLIDYVQHLCSEDTMINNELLEQDASAHDAKVDRIVANGPRGAIVVAGIATAIVVGLWILFYLLVFLPRSSTP